MLNNYLDLHEVDNMGVGLGVKGSPTIKGDLPSARDRLRSSRDGLLWSRDRLLLTQMSCVRPMRRDDAASEDDLYDGKIENREREERRGKWKSGHDKDDYGDRDYRADDDNDADVIDDYIVDCVEENDVDYILMVVAMTT